MTTVKQPLGGYLRRENPTLVCGACPPGSNTTSRILEYLIPNHIKDWTDFKYESLCSIYGGVSNQVLESEFLCQDFSAIPQKPFREIHDERSLESLLTNWNHSVVSEALSKAQEHLYTTHSKKAIYMARGGQRHIPQLVKEKRFPDWAGIQPGLSQADVQEKSPTSIQESSQGLDLAHTIPGITEDESSQGCFEYDESNDYALPTLIFNKLKRDGGMLRIQSHTMDQRQRRATATSSRSNDSQLGLVVAAYDGLSEQHHQRAVCTTQQNCPSKLLQSPEFKYSSPSTSDDSGPKIPNRPRKRSHSPLIDRDTARNDSNNGRSTKSEGSPKRPKRECKMRPGQSRDSRAQ